MDAPETTSPATLETDLLDFSSLSLEAVGSFDPSTLDSALAELYSQIDRPRVNLGSGPPGRTD
jgi:hypothetical protein